VFRSFYWKRVEELAPHMSPAAANEMYDIAAAEKMLPKSQLERLRKQLDRANGDLERSDVHTLAGHHAADDTTDLLFDASKRSQFFDVTRAIMPFGEAWREILTSYYRLFRKNPQTLRRFQQSINGLRGSGVMHTNEYGEEVITIPGSGALIDVMTGGALPEGTNLSMAAKSLSIGTSVIPGFGPAVSLPVYEMIPDEPSTDWLREVLFPYGKPQGGVGSFTPAWFKKFSEASGWTDGQTAASTVQQVMNQLATEDPSYLQDRDRLVTDAKALSQGVLIARGIAQLLSPGAPTVRYAAETPGANVATMKLADELRKLQAPESEGGKGLDYRNAVIEFIDTYGTGAAMVIVGNTEAQVAGLDATNVFADFERENRWLFDSRTEIAGYFGPHGGEFDYNAYVRQLEQQYRRRLSPNERLAAANQLLGNVRVWKAEKGMPPKSQWGDTERAYIRWLKTEVISKELPGYTAYDEFDVNKVRRQTEELFEAAADPRLADNPVAGAVRKYQTAYEEAMGRAKEMGRTSLQSEDTKSLRSYLLWTGEKLSRDSSGNPTPFATVWDRLLSREVEGEDG